MKIRIAAKRMTTIRIFLCLAIILMAASAHAQVVGVVSPVEAGEAFFCIGGNWFVDGNYARCEAGEAFRYYFPIIQKGE